MKKEKNNNNKIIVLARSKLNSIESMISKALINPEISHGEYTTVINEEVKYQRLKESITMQFLLIEELTEQVSLKLLYKIVICKMDLYCTRCLKITGNAGNRFRIMYDLGVKLCFYCIECRFLKCKSVDYEDVDHLLEHIYDIEK